MEAVRFYNQWYDVLNNFSPHAVEIEGTIYPTAEHAYQTAKCTSAEGKAAITAARSPMLAKIAANQTFASARREDWKKVKVDVMENVLRAKLTQHDEVHQALIRSGTADIAEDSPVDSFWGLGADGNGQNMLGKLWMKLRAELSEENL